MNVRAECRRFYARPLTRKRKNGMTLHQRKPVALSGVLLYSRNSIFVNANICFGVAAHSHYSAVCLHFFVYMSVYVLMLQAPCRMNGQRASTDAQCWLSRNFFNQNKHDEPQFWNRERLNGCGCARSEILPFRLGANTSCLNLGMIWKDKRLNCLTFLYANSSFCNFCRSAKGGWPFPRINFHIFSNEYPQLSLCKEDKKWENQWLDIELNARMLASLQ